MRALVALLVLAAPAASAAGLEITPVVIQLDARTRSALITLRNGGSDLSRYEVKAFAWAEGRDGKMKLEPTQDVTFYPPVMQLVPGEKRNLRVGASSGYGEVEKTYRIFIEEMPPAPVQGKSEVRLLARIGIPIFLAPTAKSVAAARIEELSAVNGRAHFAVHNIGNVRVRPGAVKLIARGADGAQLFEKSWEGWYILAGGSREFEADLPAASCGAVRRLEVTASDPDHGAISGRLEVPSGACPH